MASVTLCLLCLKILSLGFHVGSPTTEKAEAAFPPATGTKASFPYSDPQIPVTLVSPSCVVSAEQLGALPWFLFSAPRS